MATERKTVSKQGSANVDHESYLAIYNGMNISQLVQLFHLDHRTVKSKIIKSGVQPAGKRAGYDVYLVHEIAPHLVKPEFDVEGYIRRMNPMDLPKALTKEYWAGQRSRQEYELKAGNLWPTEKVVEKFGEIFKITKMSALLTVDAVERQTELSDRQRQIIKSLMHGMLEDLVKQIEKASKRNDEDEQLQQTIDSEEI